MSSGYDNDPRVVANPDGSFSLPGGHDSWTVTQVDDKWRATADHGEYANPPYWAGATADEAIGLIIGEPQTAQTTDDDIDGM